MTRHMDFAVQLAKLQSDAGRGFILEPPTGKSGRGELDALQQLQQRPEVFSLSVECVPSQHAKAPRRWPMQKSILVTNIQELAKRLSKQASSP